MKMQTDTEELYPASEQTSTRGYVLHESMGSRLSRLGLLGKIVGALAVVVLALFVTTIALGLRQQSERTLDHRNLAERKAQLQEALMKVEHQIGRIKNRSDADQSEQAAQKAQVLQALDEMRTKLKDLGDSGGDEQTKTAFDILKRNFSDVLSTFNQVQKRLSLLENEGYCPLKYNGTCTWLELRSSGIAFEPAKAICAEQGGRPANVYSRDHFYMLMGYTTMFAFRKGWMEAWLGMTYDTQNDTVLLSDGRVAPYVRWHPGYPKPSKCCRMGLNADVDQEDNSQDMFTMKSDTLLRGVLCEK